MSGDYYSLAELAELLGQDRRDIERLVSRGRVPAQKVDNEWRFHKTEIRHWLEIQIRDLGSADLQRLEDSHKDDTPTADLPIAGLLSPQTVQVPLEGRTKRGVIESLLEVGGRTWHIWEPAVVLDAILEREAVLSTGIESGVAIPHPRNPLPNSLGESLIVFGRTMSGIPFGAPKRMLSDLFFLVLCRDARTHLLALSRIGRLLQSPGLIDALRDIDDSRAAYDLIAETDRTLDS